MKKIIIFVIVLAAVCIIYLSVSLNSVGLDKVTPQPVACTMEAKICPDGSAVGRQGPNCEFSACPDVL